MIFRPLLKIKMGTSLSSIACNILVKQCNQIATSCSIQENTASVVHNKLNQTITVSFRFRNKKTNRNKLFYFNSSSTEKSSEALIKISEGISLYFSQKRPRKPKRVPEILIPVELISKSNESLDLDSVPCIESFENRSNYLKIGNIDYTLEVNLPVITALELPDNYIYSNFIVSLAKLEALNCDVEKSQFKWFHSKDTFGSYEKAKSSDLGLSQWEEIGEGYGILITEKNESRLLKVVVTPVQDEIIGSNYEAISRVLVTSKPEICPFEKRHQFTSNALSDQCFRVVSYNILADFYLNSKRSRSSFSHCPEWALDFFYRKDLLIKELLGYNADVICLQEVGIWIFDKYLKPIFSQYDLEGTYDSKSGFLEDGVATFYRKKKLRLKEKKCYTLSQELETNPLFETFYEKVKENKVLALKISQQKSVFQVCAFEKNSSPTSIVLVGTTHLFSAVDFDHIRLLQAWMCLHLLKNFAETLRLENSQYDISTIFCGDFNSNPKSAAFRLITSQHIDAQDIVWSSRPDLFQDVHLFHDLDLGNACGTPEYTNFVVDFNMCLDYIFYNKEKLSVEQVVPLPTHEDVTAHGALPSPNFPSDHLPLIADFSWKDK